MKYLLGMAGNTTQQVGMVDTNGMGFGSSFGCTRSIPSQYRVQASKVVSIIRLHTIFLVAQTFYQKISRPQREQICIPSLNKLYGSSPLLGFNYMMQELKHDLLESSKQLQSIKSKQDNDLQECICLFQYQLPHVAFYFFQTNTNQFN